MEKEPELLGVYQAAEEVQQAIGELVNTLDATLGDFRGSVNQATVWGGPCDSFQCFVKKHLPAIRCSALQLDAVLGTTSMCNLLVSYDDILKTPDNVSFDLVGALVSIRWRLSKFIVALTRETMEDEFCETWFSTFQDVKTLLSREIRRLEDLDWDIKAWVLQRAKAAILADADGTRTDQGQVAGASSVEPSRQVVTEDCKTDNGSQSPPKLSKLYDDAQDLVGRIIAVGQSIFDVCKYDDGAGSLAIRADAARDDLLNLARQVQKTIADTKAYRVSLGKADSPVPETLLRCVEDYEQHLCELEDAAKGLLLRFRLSTLPCLGTKAWVREAESIAQFSDQIAEVIHALANEPLLHDECLSQLLPNADAACEPKSGQERAVKAETDAHLEEPALSHESPAGDPSLSVRPVAERGPRLTVMLNPPQAVLDGQAFALDPDGALLVDALIKADGDWVASAKLDMRADRVRKKLPKQVGALVEAEPGKGFRIPRRKLA